MKIKTWKERLGAYHHNTDMHRAFMQAEIDDLRKELGRLESENEQRNKLTATFSIRKVTQAAEDSSFDYEPHPPMRDCDCVECLEYWHGRANEIPDGIIYENKRTPI